MLDQHTAIYALNGDSLEAIDTEFLLEKLRTYGYCLLRGYQPSLNQFSAMIDTLCAEVTYDPARALSADSVQQVDAGVGAIGLHIENGNTPRVPHLLGFYCRSAARRGSQTTLCDGQTLWQEMPADLKRLLSSTMTVTRTLTEIQWKSYLAQEHPLLESADQVNEQHLQQMLSQYKDQTATINPDGSLEYSLLTHPVRNSPLSGEPAFANTILGPSINYEPPRFSFANGNQITPVMKNRLRDFCEQHTMEIAWQAEDIVLLDNWRVMHGRRAIVDADNRELFIGMGMVR